MVCQLCKDLFFIVLPCYRRALAACNTNKHTGHNTSKNKKTCQILAHFISILFPNLTFRLIVTYINKQKDTISNINRGINLLNKEEATFKKIKKEENECMVLV